MEEDAKALLIDIAYGEYTPSRAEFVELIQKLESSAYDQGYAQAKLDFRIGE